MLATSSAPPTLGYNPSPHMGLPSGPRMGLPSGPRDTSTLPSRNRNPSSGIHPDPPTTDELGTSSSSPQQALDELIEEFYDLTWSLPRENRDLLLTITELLQRAAGESRTTKMPLSNLLLVLCPSMSMNPGVLKIFVEHHQAIFAEANSSRKDQKVQSQIEPAAAVEAPEPTSKALAETTPIEQPSQIPVQVTPPPVEQPGDSRPVFEEVLPPTALPTRKQSLRRLVHIAQGPRTTPTSSPSAYKETFTVEQPPSHSEAPVTNEVTLEPPRNSSRPTSPLRQSFSSSDLSRPAQPLGPRAPRNVPAPLALQRERSNTPERTQSVSRPTRFRSASSSSSVLRDAQPNAGVQQPSKVEEPAKVQTPPEVRVEPQPVLTPQIVDSGPPSSQGNTIEVPTLPDMHPASPMTSSFATRRSAMPTTAQLFAGLSEVSTPHSADSGMSSQSNTITLPPSLPDVHSLSPMTSSFAQRRSAMPMPSTEPAQPSPASLGVPSPDSASSAVQPLTPLLAAMEKEHGANASGLPASPDPNSEEPRTHLRVEPLTLTKKRMSNGQEPSSAISSMNSAFTDSSEATFDQQLPWPEVPKTIPMVKPGYYAMLNQQNASNGSAQSPSNNSQADSNATAQYVTVNGPDSSDLTATAHKSNFPSELHDDEPPTSPDVPNAQYPPDPYPSLQPVPQVADVPLTKKVERTQNESPERTIVIPSQPRAKGISSGNAYNAISSADTTVRPVRAHAPRLTVNSKELLAGNSFWANELQRALRSSPPTSPHEARHSAELSSMLEAAGT